MQSNWCNSGAPLLRPAPNKPARAQMHFWHSSCAPTKHAGIKQLHGTQTHSCHPQHGHVCTAVYNLSNAMSVRKKTDQCNSGIDAGLHVDMHAPGGVQQPARHPYQRTKHVRRGLGHHQDLARRIEPMQLQMRPYQAGRGTLT